MTWMIENLHRLAKSKLDDKPQGQNVYKVVFETKKSAGFFFFFWSGSTRCAFIVPLMRNDTTIYLLLHTYPQNKNDALPITFVKSFLRYDPERETPA